MYIYVYMEVNHFSLSLDNLATSCVRVEQVVDNL